MKSNFFGQWLNFSYSKFSNAISGQKWRIYFWFIKGTNGIHSVPGDEVPEIRVFLLIIGFQFVDDVLFGQVKWAVFFSGAVEIFCRQRWLSPVEKLAPKLVQAADLYRNHYQRLAVLYPMV